MKDYKINVTYCYADVYEDDYEKGEGDFVNQWDMKDIVGVYDSIEKLLKMLKYYGFSTSIKDYAFDSMNNAIISDLLTDADGMEAYKTDIEKWKNGEIMLYNARLCCGVEIVASRPMTDDDAKELGLEIY